MNTIPENSSLQTSSSIKRFGRYEVIKQLGEGAMGRVYLLRTRSSASGGLKVIALENSIDEPPGRNFCKGLPLRPELLLSCLTLR
jgi:serine/threonine protein kinase